MCEQHSSNIERLFEDAMHEVEHLAAAAMATIDETVDEIMLDIYAEHQGNLARIERAESRAELQAFISPYRSVQEWFDALPKDQQDEWREDYQRYMLVPGGDLMYEYDVVGQAVMDLLFSRDSYYKQPFCPYCDSRGHKPGACMPH